MRKRSAHNLQVKIESAELGNSLPNMRGKITYASKIVPTRRCNMAVSETAVEAGHTRAPWQCQWDCPQNTGLRVLQRASLQGDLHEK